MCGLVHFVDLASGVFISQQLIPASNGFDHNSAQKDLRHFPAIQVSTYGPICICIWACANHAVLLIQGGVFQKETGIPYNKMLFYDDEDRNVHRVRVLCLSPVMSGHA